MARSGGTFKPGQSGNPAGRKPNAINVMAKAIDTYNKANNSDAVQEIMDNIISAARTGDQVAQKYVLDRLAPPLKSVSASINIPGLPKDLYQKGERILELISSGDITPDIGKDLLASISALLNVKEKTDLEKRLKALEKHHGKT